jgi:uncharacterized protein YkwD
MRRTVIVGALAFAALLSGFTSVAKACRGTDRTPSQQSTEDARRAITCLVNHRRARAHRHHLRDSVALGMAAQGHSQAMVSGNYFSHGGDGTPYSRAASAGYEMGGRFTVGETLGFGGGDMGTPRAIFRAMMASPPHREVLMMRRFRQIGVGVAIGSPMGLDSADSATYTLDLGRH